jgi:enoyl-CoA hydratase/carnithine racemase
MQTYENLIVARSRGARHITLDRPRKMNALTSRMVEAMAHALSRWECDDRVRFVLSDARKRIAESSPTSLKLTLRALREARALPSLRACLALEYRIMCRRYGDHDTIEGVRAAVVDKDRQPNWCPATLAAITPADVDAYFTIDTP